MGVTVSICATSSCLVAQEAAFQTKAQEKPPQTPAADLVTVQRVSFALHQDAKGYCGQRILVWLLLENSNNENILEINPIKEKRPPNLQRIVKRCKREQRLIVETEKPDGCNQQ